MAKPKKRQTAAKNARGAKGAKGAKGAPPPPELPPDVLAGKPKPARKPRKKPRQKLIQLTLDQQLDILGVLLAVAGGIILLTMLPGQNSPLTGALLRILQGAVGWGVYPVPFGLIAIGVWLLVRHFGDRLPRVPPERVLGLLLVWLAALPSLHFLAALYYTDPPDTIAAAGLGGGYAGLAMQQMLVATLDQAGAVVALVAWWIIALALAFGTSVAALLGVPVRALLRARGAGRAGGKPVAASAGGWGTATPPPAQIIGGASTPAQAQTPAPVPAAGRRVPLPAPPAPTTPPTAPVTAPAAPAAAAGGGFGNAMIIGDEQHWELPALPDILEEGVSLSTNDEFDRQRAEIIQHTLASFGVPVTVTGCNRGPAITQFEVKPGFIEGRGGKTTKVKVSRIAGLADDLALALAAPSIRIEAPIPGRDVVGVEVPNERTEIVALRDIMESETFAAIRGALGICLGADVSGQPAAADLTRMPHLLVAGTTGSGKSVCVNSIIACLLMRNTPDQLKFIMVDPKRVELTNYNGIPHLIAPVVVDLERVVGVLQWVTKEMDERYRRFAKLGARNIDDHNNKAEGKGEQRLPFIIVVIDELADLMMLAPEETERTICRLAQMARATGIHLIIATQRPSVDVITGLIKANFPARIAFAVASSVDSRVILDGPGAERLLGRGDMLFMSPEAGQPVRLQGCWVSDREIGRLVRYWKNARGLETDVAASAATPQTPPLTQPPLWDELRELESKAQEVSQNEDELLEDAIGVVRASGKASISLLQRRLRIGYTRAARLIDLLEEKGIVGPAKEGSTPRDVLPPRPGQSPYAGAPPLPPEELLPPPANSSGTPASLRGHRPMGQNPPPSDPGEIPPWRD
jgi:S-DNA-T family DNA segregation ATPase FtsK/SpoIIIE